MNSGNRYAESVTKIQSNDSRYSEITADWIKPVYNIATTNIPSPAPTE
jgi:hypothetical protein